MTGLVSCAHVGQWLELTAGFGDRWRHRWIVSGDRQEAALAGRGGS